MYYPILSVIDLKLSFFAVSSFILMGLGLSLMILVIKGVLVGSKQCRLLINEDEKLTKYAKTGATLLESLLSQGISIPSPCGGKGTCKQCKVQVMNFQGKILEIDKATFPPAKIREGWRLSCQSKVKGDVKLKIPESLLTVKEFSGTVVSNNNVASFIKELEVQIDEDTLPEGIHYKAGAYLQVVVPPYKTNTSDWKETMEPKYYEDWDRFQMFNKVIDYTKPIEEVQRAYSMASFPAEKNLLKFNIRIATPPFAKGKLKNKPWGICSTYLFSLKPGDKVSFTGPYGESYMIEDDRELIFLIGGAGSSFGRAHILDLFKTRHTKRKVTLWYGARSIKENIYQEDFEKLAQEFENFTYHLVLSEPSLEDIKTGWPTKEQDPIKTNFAFKAFEMGQLKKIKEPDECLYYVCGPPLHNSSCMKLLEDYGVPRENIVLDDFGS